MQTFAILLTAIEDSGKIKGGCLKRSLLLMSAVVYAMET